MPQLQAFAVTDAAKNAEDEERFAALDTHRPDDWMGASDHNPSSRGSLIRGSNHGPHSPKKKVLTLAEAREKIAHLAAGDADITTSEHLRHGNGSSSSRFPSAPVMDASDHDDVVEYDSAFEDETEVFVASDGEDEEASTTPYIHKPNLAKPSLLPTTNGTVSKPMSRPDNSDDAGNKPAKRISVFELQMEGIASKDHENIERVNPSATIKPSQAPEGYEDNEASNPLLLAAGDIDLDALTEAPRVARSKMDPTSRPRAMRGNSFGGTEHDEAAAMRRAAKKPVDKHLESKNIEPESDFSKPVAVDEAARPDYAQRPGNVRGKSDIDEDKVMAAASPKNGAPKKTTGTNGVQPSHAAAAEAMKPAKRISVFELQMEGMASKDSENIERVNPSAKIKPSQAPDGYEDEGNNSLVMAAGDIDLDALPEAPRVSRSKMDPTSRPRAMRGNSFGGTEHDEAAAVRRAAKKPVDKHLEGKNIEPESDFSKPVAVDEAARPDYAQRPGNVRGKSDIDEDKLIAAASPKNGKKKMESTGTSSLEHGHVVAAEAEATKPAKRISVFELQMEGIASKDSENIDRVNPSVKIKPSQAPEGYEDNGSNPLALADGIDLDALPEAPRAPRSKMDPTSRPRALRGNSFGGTEHDEAAAVRRAAKKPVEKHLEEMAGETSEFSKPIAVEESARPDYAQRPGVVRGKSGIDEEKVLGIAASIRAGGKKKSLAVSRGEAADIAAAVNGHEAGPGGITSGIMGSHGDMAATNNLPAFLKDRPSPPSHTDSNEPLPNVIRESGFGVALRGTKKGEKLLAGQEIAHRVGGIKLVDEEET